MRPDGFGGMAVLITAEAMHAKSTQDILRELLDQAEYGPIGVAPGHGIHVLLSLTEENVRVALPEIIGADPAMTRIAPDDVTDTDIRVACFAVAERTDLSEEQGLAVFNAALVAIKAAEDRATTTA
jgi:hypothetical protein